MLSLLISLLVRRSAWEIKNTWETTTECSSVLFYVVTTCFAVNSFLLMVIEYAICYSRYNHKVFIGSHPSPWRMFRPYCQKIHCQCHYKFKLCKILAKSQISPYPYTWPSSVYLTACSVLTVSGVFVISSLPFMVAMLPLLHSSP